MLAKPSCPQCPAQYPRYANARLYEPIEDREKASPLTSEEIDVAAIQR